MFYLLFLKGINVGGKHKVVMSDLKKGLMSLGLANVSSYINSGNLIFSSPEAHEPIRIKIERLLKDQYDFEIPFALIEGQVWLEEMALLPDWWKQAGGRRDAFFFTEAVGVDLLDDFIQRLDSQREPLLLTRHGMYIADLVQEEFLKTNYQKLFVKSPLAQVTTNRNRKTLEKMRDLLSKKIDDKR